MDAEKIEVYCRLWEQAKIFCRALSELAEEPENKQALDAASRSFPELQPHLSDTLRDYIFFQAPRSKRGICEKPEGGF